MIKIINLKKRMMGWYKIEFLRDYLSLFEFILLSCLGLYFRWHDIKDEEIYNPMEKIWVKKELYK